MENEYSFPLLAFWGGMGSKSLIFRDFIKSKYITFNNVSHQKLTVQKHYPATTNHKKINLTYYIYDYLCSAKH